MKVIFFAISLISLTGFASEGKLAEVYTNSAQTFFCGCAFDIGKMQLNDPKCVSNNFITSPIPESVQWTYLIPESKFTEDLQCWHEPESYQECAQGNKGSLSAHLCCRKVSPEYRERNQNIHNLVPILSKFIQYKDQYRLGQIYDQQKNVSSCTIRWDEKDKRLEPPDPIKGDIARIYFYFESLGYIHLSHRTRPLMEIWDMKDPVSESECQLQAQKASQSGLKNPYVANRCR